MTLRNAFMVARKFSGLLEGLRATQTQQLEAMLWCPLRLLRAKAGGDNGPRGFWNVYAQASRSYSPFLAFGISCFAPDEPLFKHATERLELA